MFLYTVSGDWKDDTRNGIVEEIKGKYGAIY